MPPGSAGEPMTSAFVLVLAIAGFALLVFGEQMGFEAAARPVGAIFLVAMLALVLSATTGRLNRYMVAPGRGAIAGLAALFCAVLLLEAVAMPKDGLLGARLGWLLAGLGAGLALRPANLWRNFVVADRAGQRDADPGAESVGAMALFNLTGAVGLGALILLYWPGVTNAFGGASLAVIRDEPARLLILAALLIVPGGILGLRRCAILLAAIAVFSIALPATIGGLGFALDELGLLRPDHLGPLLSPLAKEAMTPLMKGAFLPESFARGLVLALALAPALAAAHGPVSKMTGLMLGLVFALGLLVVSALVDARLAEFINERLARFAPAQWPHFVFEDSLRGWISACGAAAIDPASLTKACAVGARASLPHGALQVDPTLWGAASAMALGWPAVLGHIWQMLPMLIAFVAFAALLNALASLVSEQAMFRLLRPRALRSWRLASARLGVIALAASIFVLTHAGFPDAKPLRVLLLGGAASMLCASIGYVLIRLTRWLGREKPAAYTGSEETVSA